jgi:hypothetical protein
MRGTLSFRIQCGKVAAASSKGAHKVDTGYDKAEVNKVAICRAVNKVSLHNVRGAVPV